MYIFIIYILYAYILQCFKYYVCYVINTYNTMYVKMLILKYYLNMKIFILIFNILKINIYF